MKITVTLSGYTLNLLYINVFKNVYNIILGMHQINN